MGGGCKSCHELHENVQKAVANMKLDAEVEYITDQVKALVEPIEDAYAANMNSLKQTVVSGTFDALAEVEKKAAEAGARRAVRLKAR